MASCGSLENRVKPADDLKNIKRTLFKKEGSCLALQTAVSRFQTCERTGSSVSSAMGRDVSLLELLTHRTRNSSLTVFMK